MDMEFRSEQELYERLLPALRTKKGEMVRSGLSYIKEEDIWNYLKEIKWRRATNLSLYEMVSDVLDTNDLTIDTYLKQKLKGQDRKTYFEVDNNESKE